MTNNLKLVSIVAVYSTLLIGCAATTPAPVSSIHKDYNSIERGSYRGSYYEVKKGDTLYFIAYVTDKNVNDLIRYNDLSAPYTIRPGEKLKLWQPVYAGSEYGKSRTKASSTPAVSVTAVNTVNPSPKVSSIPEANSSPKVASKSSVSPKKPTSNNSKATKNTNSKAVDQSKSKEYVEPKSKQNVNKTVNKVEPTNNKINDWLWPTKGRIIKKFSVGEQGNKGIDIAGQRGQSIVSTASGKVVYSGNALRGYGNLIIVKHNDNYLSAYAHNERLLVSEGQNVSAGQKIATMGSSGSNSVRLHFEIRYQGKSVNPNRYLP
ncbi:peptidoglycan DD-metalloendopeptidase family protein [Vibrio sp. TH_r3]|uniref:peptidoglycan DD-metalloendopeptidase family protein n=1 Tax=Vibrio sp. TH_r3 TaxID=3082084 RepID=UPI0029549270|nr:peptidoglycan DD-metalloendopeptidase family protein [Vibrio sp. TH_r3]MDV7105190.1 peptidoglycan DD-metalloendopeptidase family protein [Vibrio sp. TH_r3]